MANPYTSAQAPAANMGMQIIAPDIAAEQVRNARLAQLAQLLTARSFEQDKGTEVINGWAVKKAPAENLSKLASVLGGVFLQTQSDKKNTELNKGFAERAAAYLSGGAAPSGDGSEIGAGGAGVGSTGSPGLVTGSAGGGSAGRGLGLPEIMRGLVTGSIGGDNAEKEYYLRGRPTDATKREAELGIALDQARQLEMAKRTNDATLNLRQGATIQRPDGTMFTAPDQDKGTMLKWDAQGNPSVSVLPGSEATISALEAAKQTGQNRATPASTDLLIRNPDGTYVPKTIDQVINPVQSGIEPAGLPSKLIDNMIMIESSGNPNAVNPKSGAQGLGQFMPTTVKMLADQGYKFDPFNKVEARKAMGDYLSTLIDQNGGDVRKALAAYGGFKTKDPTSYVNRALEGVNFAGAPKQQGAGEPFGLKKGIEGNVDAFTKRFDALVNENAGAPVAIDALENIKKYAPGAIVGGLQEKRAFANSVLSLFPGLADAKDTQTKTALLQKNIARIVGNTPAASDLARTIAENSNPNAKMNVPAIIEAANQLQSIVKMKLANQQLLQDSRLNNDFKTGLQKDFEFSKVADPKIWQLQLLSPEEQVKFVGKLSPSEAKELKNKRAILREMGAL